VIPIAASRSVSAAVPFSPKSLANLWMWSAARLLTGFVNTDPVTTITDASGNGRTRSSSGTQRGIYETGIVNGLPALHMNADGVGDDVYTFSSTLNFKDFTIFVVGRDDRTSVGSVWFGASGSADDSNRYIDSNKAGSQLRLNISGTEANATGNAGIFHVAEFVRVSDGGWFCSYNGTDGTATSSGNTNNLDMNTMGYPPASAAANVQGYWCEDIVYNRILTTNERSLVRSYLGRTYNISVA
jgi:hypothetical protein